MSYSCDPMDCSSPASSVHGIFQARMLEKVAISYSRGSSWPRDRTCISMSPALAGRFFTTEPPGRPSKNESRKVKPTVQFSSVQLPSCVRLFATPWTAACQASLPLTISHPVISSSDALFSFWPQSFPASRTFHNEIRLLRSECLCSAQIHILES